MQIQVNISSIRQIGGYIKKVFSYVPKQDWDCMDVNELMRRELAIFGRKRQEVRHNNNNNNNELIATFVEVVEGAANLAIPKRSCNGQYTPVPLWNRECQYTHNERKKSQHIYQRTRSV